jgi:very-short-patch-repair endonuclease
MNKRKTDKASVNKVTKERTNRKTGAVVNKRPKTYPKSTRSVDLLTMNFVKEKLTELALLYELVYKEELIFDKLQNRKYRFDFAFECIKVAIEIDGGIFQTSMGHSTGEGIMRDMEKSNLSALNGWLLFRFSYHHTKDYFTSTIETIIKNKTKI